MSQRAGVAVDVLEQRGAQQGLAAPIASLDKLRPKGALLQQEGNGGHDENGEQGDREAEQDHAAIPDRLNIRCGKALKELYWQRGLKDKIVHPICKTVVNETDFMEKVAGDQQQKDRHGGIEAEHQIFHMYRSRLSKS